MKKFLLVGALASAFLVGCEYAEEVDNNFGNKAVGIFKEIDDDTMTNELSDRDDIANFDLLTVEANSEPELDAVKAMDKMLKLQEQVVKGDRLALQNYLRERNNFFDAMGLEERSHQIEHDIPEFEFYEDDEPEYETYDD